MSATEALERLRAREEVLQICYWYQGEGFGDRFTPATVQPFLPMDRTALAEILAALAGEGALAQDGDGYRFTAEGKRRAGRLFVDAFAEFQTGTHGECTAGCCDEDGACDHV